MMSKNSFWANLRENNKRRIWVWIVSALLWFFYYPVGMTLFMSRKKNHNIIDRFTGEAARERLEIAAGDWLFPNVVLCILIALLAVICAVHGFSYLYSRKKIDLYHSVPVKKSRRFAVIYINGLLIFFAPYLMGLLLALLSAGINGAMNGRNITVAIAALIVNTLLYLGIYSLTILAVMLTGNLLITLCAVAVFLLYELVLRALFFGCESMFFDYYSWHSEKIVPILSPVNQYIEAVKSMRGAEPLSTMLTTGMPALLLMLFMAAGFSAAAYFCYRKRPSEAAGKPMVFAVLKPVVKLAIVIPAALWVGASMNDIVGGGESSPIAAVVFGIAAAVVIGCGVFEVIYAMDIRAAFQKKSQMLMAGAGCAVIYCMFSLDLFGFDAWLPDAEKLESAVIILNEDAYNKDYVGKDFEYMNATDYLLAQKGITDKELILEFSEKKINPKDCDEYFINCEVAYRMKNGKTIWREFAVKSSETEILNRLLGNKEYKQMLYQLYDDTFYQNLKNYAKSITMDNGYWEKELPLEELDKIRELYLKDLEAADYDTYREEWMIGVLEIQAEAKQEELRRSYWSSSRFSYSIYPSYTNTIGYLKEKGIYEDMTLKAEDIEGITVENYHNEMYEEQAEGSEKEINYDSGDFTVRKEFADKEQIEELLDAMYSNDFAQRWKADGAIDPDYFVTVQFKDDEKKANKNASLITDRVPEWLEKETAYE